MLLRLMAPALLAALAACAVGPNFHRPSPPADRDYGNAPAQGTTVAAPGTGGAAQTFTAGGEIPGQWWTLFESPKLNSLVEQSLKGNPNIDAARASLREADHLYKAQRAALLPNVQGGFDATRAKNAVETLANPTSLPQVNPYYNLYTAQLSLSYMPDVFGGTRRALEAGTGAGRGHALRARSPPTSRSAATSWRRRYRKPHCADRSQPPSASSSCSTSSPRRCAQQRSLGTASNLDLLPQETLEAQTAATLPPLQKQLGQTPRCPHRVARAAAGTASRPRPSSSPI